MTSSSDKRQRAIVLAAGLGTRMRSARPKVLHEVAGRPMVSWAVGAALEAGVEGATVVVGHGRELVEAELFGRFDDRVQTVVQAEQLGTGDAVATALRSLDDFEGELLITYGDCPLLRAETLQRLLEVHERGSTKLSMITGELADPTGYGRIVRQDGAIVAIREQRDCSVEEAAISEVNPGLYLVDATFLREALAGLGRDNAQGELLLTDIVAAAAADGGVGELRHPMQEMTGVNDRWELARVNRLMRKRILRDLCRAGVGMLDPTSTFVDADCEVEADAMLEAGVHLRGRCQIAAGATVGVGSVLRDVRVEQGARVLPYTVAEQSSIGESAQVGPFSHLRSGSELGVQTRVGNFVETKKTKLGRGSKISHLSYAGDGLIGEGVNIGAGTIFCNYDGFSKNTTVLEDGVFIGSDSQLIAPLTVGRGAYVASGTTVTRDIPADALAISRTRQVNKEDYGRRLRARLAPAKKSSD